MWLRSTPRASGGDPQTGATIHVLDAYFPAQAGVIQSWDISKSTLQSIPRTSGDDPKKWLFRIVMNLYSPRKRV